MKYLWRFLKAPSKTIEKVLNTTESFTARKVSKYGDFSGPCFLVFRLNTEKYGTKKNFVFGHFSRSAWLYAAISSLYVVRVSTGG